MANKTWLGNVSTWATAAQWNPTGVPASTDDVFINGGTCTVGAQTCKSLTINGNCTLAGTSLTVSNDLNVISGMVTCSMTGGFNLTGNLNNSGGYLYTPPASAMIFQFTGTSNASADFGASNILRQLTIARTGGTLTLTGNPINVRSTGNNSSNFTFTSGTIVQNVIIYCGALTNNGTTSRSWAMNADVIVGGNGNGVSFSFNHTGQCTLTSRTGTIRIQSIGNGSANTVTFYTPATLNATAYQNAPNISLESDTSWTMTGTVNNIALMGRCTTASNINVFGEITNFDGAQNKNMPSLNINYYNTFSNVTKTIDIGTFASFGTVTTQVQVGTSNPTWNILSLKATTITLSTAATFYFLGASNDTKAVEIVGAGTLTLGAASTIYYINNVKSYNNTLNGTSATYYSYRFDHNRFNTTGGTTTHTAGTLTLKSGYTLTTWTFTSITGTRGINFENNSWVVTLDSTSGSCSYQYGPSLGVNTVETNSFGFVHLGGGQWQADFVTTAPAQNKVFNFYWKKTIALAGTGVFYVRTLGNMTAGESARYTTNYDVFDTGWGTGAGAFTNTTARTINIYGDFIGNGGSYLEGNSIAIRTQWNVLNLNYTATDGRTQLATTYTNWYNGGYEINRLGTITLSSTFNGTLSLGVNKIRHDRTTVYDGEGSLRCTNFIHDNGTLDLRGLKLYIQTQYVHNNTTNIKQLTTNKVPAVSTTQSTVGLSNVQIVSTTGDFSCDSVSTGLTVGQIVSLTGSINIGLSAAIYDYPNTGGNTSYIGKSFKISATNGSTSFTLVNIDGSAISTFYGTSTAGLNMEAVYITNTVRQTERVYSDPGIEIGATTGTVWKVDYTQILYSNWKVWVKINGGTITHGYAGQDNDRQPSFDLSTRSAAHVLTNRLDANPAAPHFSVGSLRINSYTPVSGGIFNIGGPEFSWYTGGVTAPAELYLNIFNSIYQYDNTTSKGVTQLYVDSNTFAWPQVTINTDAALTSSAWKFKNVIIDSGTLTSNGQFVEITGILTSNYYGNGTLNNTNSNWVFRGSGTVINYVYNGSAVRVISDSTGTLTFDGLNGTQTGDQTAGFVVNYGGKIINNIGYNTSTSTGTLYLTAGSSTDVTKPVASQIDFNFSTSSMSFYLDKPSQDSYGFPIKGSTFNIGSSSAGYRYLAGRSDTYSNWGIYNTESTNVVSGDYLYLTSCPAKGGNGWYAGTHSVDNGGNTGWTFAAPATYSLSRSATTVDEGSSVTITLTTNAVNGTLVPYTISGTNITSADISGASLTGNFTVNSGTAAVVLNIAADYATEGNETFTLALNNGAASIAVAIIDTTLTPTYNLSRSAASVTEGNSFTITLNTTNLPNGYTVPYVISGTNITSADINGASLTGNFTINGNSASLVINTTWDYLTESTETLTVTINPTIGSSSSISVDIINLLHPTYSLSANPTSLNEGSSFTITLNTTDVPNNTLVPYTITGTGITSADISSASLTGNFTVISNTASVIFTAAADYLTEGNETLTLTLDTIGTNVSVVIVDYYKTRTYSLSTSATAVTEGDSFTITLTTTNVFDGTTVPYTISGTGITSADIAGASLTGNFTITGNSGTQTFTTTADLIAEGTETFTLTLGSPASGSINVSITDPVSGAKGNFLSFFD
jgi:hypothetical protein